MRCSLAVEQPFTESKGMSYLGENPISSSASPLAR